MMMRVQDNRRHALLAADNDRSIINEWLLDPVMCHRPAPGPGFVWFYARKAVLIDICPGTRVQEVKWTIM